MTKFRVQEFDSPASSAFKLYLQAERPYFVLTHDGTPNVRGDLEKGDLCLATLQQGTFLRFIRFLMSHSYNIGHIQDIEFRSSKV